MIMNMKSVVIRYGLLLALFLIVLDVAQRSYMSRFLSDNLYIAFVAIVFLLFGGWLALRLFRKDAVTKGNNLTVVDPKDFSDRETEILLFLCHGYTNNEIAENLMITTNTVKTHLKNIYSKLGVSNRTQAAAEAKMLNIIG